MGRKPKIWTAVDRDYETVRIGIQTLFRHFGIQPQPAAAWTTFCRSEGFRQLELAYPGGADSRLVRGATSSAPNAAWPAGADNSG
jgi:hypothetical protein